MSEVPSPETRDQAGETTRPTLAARLAERSRQRALRAERLARLRPPTGAAAPADEAEAALQEFLRALTGDLPPASLPPPRPAAAVLAFQRPASADGVGDGSGVETAGAMAGAAAAAAAGISDLESLPGVGPNLVWALEQAGIGCLADLVPLAPAELAHRLGPLGRLVPAASWIAAARATVPVG
ncbi:MAG TPA: hypothetical protein VM891_07620 [Amaricoccus sp.]|nr:hypothetical protein [Amaricoccus sp.]